MEKLRKVCNACKKLKELTDYHRTPLNKDGRIGTCKPCRIKQEMERLKNLSPQQKWELDCKRREQYKRRREKARSELLQQQ